MGVRQSIAVGGRASNKANGLFAMSIGMIGGIQGENVQGKKVAGFGRCIYCGSDGGAAGLDDEHVLPYSLGGRAVIEDASCKQCGAVTSYLDGYLANRVFKHSRVHSRIQSRSGHPNALPTEVRLQDGSEATLSLPVDDHPFFVHMPTWGQPGVLLGEMPTEDFGPAKSNVFWFTPATLPNTLGLGPGEVAHLRDTTPMPNLRTFARAIAKIAYCHAVMQLGLDGFRPLVLPQLILGTYPNIPYFVGCESIEPPPRAPHDQMHTIQRNNMSLGRLRLIMMSVRLFGRDGTDEYGMPVYWVVVGAHHKAL